MIHNKNKKTESLNKTLQIKQYSEFLNFTIKRPKKLLVETKSIYYLIKQQVCDIVQYINLKRRCTLSSKS